MMLRPLPPEGNGLGAKSQNASESRSRRPGAALEHRVDQDHDPVPRLGVWGSRDWNGPAAVF